MSNESVVSALPCAEAPSVRAFSRKNRVYVFREFLLDTYRDYLAQGDVVLDVAGGKGDLSWLLTNIDEFCSIVVDPRVSKSQHIVKSLKYLRSHPEEARQRAVPNCSTHQPLAALLSRLDGKELDCVLPTKHFRILVDEKLVEAVRSAKEQLVRFEYHVVDKSWRDFWRLALERGLNTHMLGHKEEEETKEKTTADDTLCVADEALRLLLRCRLVVGFHPDQATDSCIDLALALGVPFCVVPCCVFPSEFPHRRLRDGSRVRDYPGLLEYLQTKAVSIKIASLAFHETTTARNTVLYTTPLL